MLLKGLVRIFTAILIIFSLWRLSFTYFTNNVESQIKAQAESNVNALHGDKNLKPYQVNELVNMEYIRLADSARGEEVVSIFGIPYTYQEIKQKELKLGLDLQGGMSVTLEVGIDELVKSMSNNPTSPIITNAIAEANRLKANTEADFIQLFGEAFEKLNPGMNMAQYFTKVGESRILPTSSNAEVLTVIREESVQAFDRTYKVLVNRINSTGLENANVNPNPAKGIITVELAGIQDPVSLRNNLQAAAKLQFWEVYMNHELGPNLNAAYEASIVYLKNKNKTNDSVVDTSNVTNETNEVLAVDSVKSTDSSVANTSSNPLDQLSKDTNSLSSITDTSKKEQEESLFSYMQPSIDGNNQFSNTSYIGAVAKNNVDKVLEILNSPTVKSKFPSNVKFMIGSLPGDNTDKNDPKIVYGIYAIKTVPGTDRAKLEGDRVKTAKFDFDQQKGEPIISLTMDQQGSQIWAELTGANINRPIAISLDDYIYSAPNVNQKITGGQSQISGNFTVKSGTELANILQVGKLDAPAKIVQEQIIGSTLGEEAIQGGLMSFVISFFIIFVLMIVYYNTGGWVANVALIVNLIITFGILAYFGATLTMPGIAGLVLGIGMAVDVNVIIFERIKEELMLGKSYEQAVADGYKRSYAPVLDSHITGLITAAILLYFGFGAIKGFATTQLIALTLSLFTGIFTTRMFTDFIMRKGNHFKYFTSFSKRLFQKAHFKFVEKRKRSYVLAAIVVLLGISTFFIGFDKGVEFAGGRSYEVQLQNEYTTEQLRDGLKSHLGDKTPLVKTIGTSNKFEIVTDYMIAEQSKHADSVVLQSVYNGLKAGNFISSDVTLSEFNSQQYLTQTNMVLPSISKDLTRGAIYAAIFAIAAIFIYILVRFRKWQYSLATIVSLIHDSAMILIVYSFCRHIVPFTLEIDQHFIAAMLTIIGFSMNDKVIVFDRIREYFSKKVSGSNTEIINSAINNTLSRTVMTSLTVFLTVLVLFIFGGDVLRGFAFAMMIGVIIGTYSSIFVSAPMLVDLDKKDTLKHEEDSEERIKAVKAKA